MSLPSDRTAEVWVLLRDLSRTGVPVVLLRLLRALGSDAPRIHVIARRPGPLHDEVAASATTVRVLEPGAPRSGPASVANALRLAGRELAAQRTLDAAWRLRSRGLPHPDVVVVHGAGGWPLVRLAPSAPRVLWLHELEVALDRSIPPTQQSEALAACERVLAVSRAVADVAVRRGARPDAVSLLPGMVEVEGGPGPTAPDPRSVAVMGAGTPGWRKGTDRLAALAFELERRGWPDSVGWVGGAPVAAAAPRVGAPDPVRWLDPLDEPWEVLGGASVVVVPSREDPLPLVALEAGLHGLPVVAMPTGGLPELLGADRGRVAPRQDLRWFADATIELLEDPEQARRLGRRLRDHVVRHHDSRVVAKVWLEQVLGVVQRTRHR